MLAGNSPLCVEVNAKGNWKAGGEKRRCQYCLLFLLISWFVVLFFYISHQNVSSLRPENLSYLLLSPQCLAYCPEHGGWPMDTWWMLLNKYGPPLGAWRQVAVQPQRKGVCREFEESHTVRLCVVSLEPVTCSIANLHPTPSLVHIKNRRTQSTDSAFNILDQ